jgi:hypothetical protein
LDTRHGLAFFRGRAGDASGAATAFAQLLEDRLRIQGPDHPNTLASRRSLALWREVAADAALGANAAPVEPLGDSETILWP